MHFCGQTFGSSKRFENTFLMDLFGTDVPQITYYKFIANGFAVEGKSWNLTDNSVLSLLDTNPIKWSLTYVVGLATLMKFKTFTSFRGEKEKWKQ